MNLWEKAAAELIDIVEWNDDSSDTLVWRFPRYENEIKNGAQLIVRQSQAALFVNRGKIADVFTSGMHRLTTENLPLLSTLMGWKYGFHSPFKAEVYFVNIRNFTNLKWGTKNPVMLRDPEFGPVRLRAFGSYVIRVGDPAKFIREIVGTGAHFTLEGVTEQLKNLIVTRFSDLLGESGIPMLDLASRYDELSTFLAGRIAPEFHEYGLEVGKLLVENISLPEEVEQALDKRSSMGILGNLDNYLKFQSANAMEAAAKNQGGDAGAGIGMGMGFAMANQMGKMVVDPQGPSQAAPPPFPQEAQCSYYVGKNGQQAGPFDIQVIDTQIKSGALTRETLVWKAGLDEWKSAAEFPEFVRLFAATPPPLTR
jgi:membrane protease subunit (stomatin/prohibitin family)